MSNPIFQLWRAIGDFAWGTGTMAEVFQVSSHSGLSWQDLRVSTLKTSTAVDKVKGSDVWAGLR